MSRARDDELTFVLLGRDEDAPDTIRDWVRRRIRRGKNRPDDQQMAEALACAEAMELERNVVMALPQGSCHENQASAKGA